MGILKVRPEAKLTWRSPLRLMASLLLTVAALTGSTFAAGADKPMIFKSQSMQVGSQGIGSPKVLVESTFTYKAGQSSEFTMIPAALAYPGKVPKVAIAFGMDRQEGVFGSRTTLEILAKPGLLSGDITMKPALKTIWGTLDALQLPGDIELGPGKRYKASLSVSLRDSEFSAALTEVGKKKPIWEGYFPLVDVKGLEGTLHSAAGVLVTPGTKGDPWRVEISGMSASAKYRRAPGPGILVGARYGSIGFAGDDGMGLVENDIHCLMPGASITYDSPKYPMDLKGEIRLELVKGAKPVHTGKALGKPGQAWAGSLPITGEIPVGFYEVWATYMEGGYTKVLEKSKARIISGSLTAIAGLTEQASAHRATDNTVKGSIRFTVSGKVPPVDMSIEAKAYNADDTAWKQVWTARVDLSGNPGDIPFEFVPKRLDLPQDIRLKVKAEPGVFAEAKTYIPIRELWVSPQGRDDWSGRRPDPLGSEDGPFATISAAAGAIRRMKEGGELPKGGITVWIKGGTYRLGETIAFSSEDSGDAQSPITYRAMPGEHPVIQGGPAIKGFKPYKDGILVADLASQGIGPFEYWPRMFRGNGAVPGMEVFYKGKRQQLARWPNADPTDSRGGAWEYVAKATGTSKERFGYAGDRPKAWKSLEGAMVNIWPDFNWHDELISLGGVDIKTNELILGEMTDNEIKPGRRFAVLGLLEELDVPGEWYYDQHTNKLYYKPEGELTDGDLVVSSMETAISVDGAAYLSFVGLGIEAFRGTAVTIGQAEDVTLKACTLRNIGGTGVSISSSIKTGISGCDIYETGRGGVTLDGGDRISLEAGGNFVDNSHIHHYGRIVKCYQAGVTVSGVGNTISHNLIHDGPHNAILLSGNDHIIEFNEIHHVCMEGADSGAFYMGRDWSMQGNILRFNHFHDIAGFGLENEGNTKAPWKYEAPHAAWAIYLDDCASGTTVFGNLFTRVPLGAVMIGGGRNNTVENNVIVDSSPAVHLDARWDAYEHYYTTQKEHLDYVNYLEPPYGTKYPGLLKIYDKDPRIPMDNRISRNIVSYSDDNWRGSWNMSKGNGVAVLWEFQNYDPETFTVDQNLVWHGDKPVRVDSAPYKKAGGVKPLSAWRKLGFDTHSLVADPLFTNPDKGDYRLMEGSPAASLGFQPLPYDRMGLYESQDRATWPVAPDTRKDGTTYSVFTVTPGKK